jgi:sugar phosphate permease
LAGSALAIRRPLALRVALALQVVGAGVLLVPAPLVLAAAGLVVLGIGFTPALSTMSLAVSQRAGGTAESFGWQSTALGLGVAGGSAVAGALAAVAAHLSALPCVLGASVCLVLVSVVRFGAVRDEQRGDGGEDRGARAGDEQRTVRAERG